MKDIIERLRAADIGWSGDASCVDADTADEGAAEIERLRREVTRLEETIAMWRKHAYEVGRLLNAGPGQQVKV